MAQVVTTTRSIPVKESFKEVKRLADLPWKWVDLTEIHVYTKDGYHTERNISINRDYIVEILP